MQSPQNPSQAAGATASATIDARAVESFAPLPLRARGVLETFDVAVKVFRRYFKVLISWAAFVAMISGVASVLATGAVGANMSNPEVMIGRLFSTFLLAAFLSIVLWPLGIGAVGCCLAAAVRGQKVSFGQCWQFTRPRYGGILGSCIAAGLLAIVITMGATIICLLVLALSTGAFAVLPRAMQWVSGILGFLIFFGGMTCVMSLLGTWFSMVPIVVCMEDDKRNTRSMGRASELLGGHWRRALALGFVLALANLLLGIVAQTTIYLLGQLPRLIGVAQGIEDGATNWILVLLGSVIMSLISAIATPFSFLVVGLFYLDLRIRKEALDLEWAAHTTAPTEIRASSATSATAFGHGELASSGFNSQSTAPNSVNDLPPMTASPMTSSPPVESPSSTSGASFSGPLDATLFDSSPNVIAHPPREPIPPANSSIAAPPDYAQSALTQTSFAQDSGVAAASTDALSPHMSTHAAGQSAARSCPQCGAPCEETQTFCMQCGARLPDAAAR